MKAFNHQSKFALILCMVGVLTTQARTETTLEQTEWTLIHAGTLLAVPGNPAKSQQTLVIHKGKIQDIRPGYLKPSEIGQPLENVRVLDLSSSFVMPGFIDLHVHFTSGPQSTDPVRNTDADIVFDAYVNAKKTLMSGFTTVRNLGSEGQAMFALRDAIKAGKIEGPKILVAGYTITPTGGHADIHGYIPSVSDILASSCVCDGPVGCRAAVRRQVKRGADVIKVTATGGGLSETGTGTGIQFTQDELNAIVETAHNLGRKVTAHAHGKAGIEAALKAGFDSIEHAMWADAETMEMFKEYDAWIIPTVYPITYVGDTPESVPRAILTPILWANAVISLG